MTIQGTLPWKRSVADFAIIGGLALLFIAACASAFSMLVWDPVADPTAAAASAVVSTRSGRVQPEQSRRGEKSEQDLGPKGSVFFDPSANEP